MTIDTREVARYLMTTADEYTTLGDVRGAASLYKLACEYALGDRDAELTERRIRRDAQITAELSAIADHYN